ncbi:alpha/beta fold hydrolase [Geomicrobium sp. JCM 19037]|uniref:alpha/beta fold hydrolase n=1 Tax=Geomicrobium sp. JCM 19037 TaxID=1460634 RepID=UPI001EE6520B|nr:alpha/beta hydrolase [Geomicrobium sp. JCM 19037]
MVDAQRAVVIEVNIHYETYRSGNRLPLLVFLHGGGVSGWMWQEQVEYFRDYECIVPDLLGHGRSSKSHFSIHDCADELLALIEQYKDERQVTVIGFSLGAQVLVSMLSKHPSLIDRALIISASTRPIKFHRVIATMATWSLPLARNKAFARLQAKQLYISDQYFQDYYKETVAMPKTIFHQVMTENLSFSIPEGFEDTNCKMLVIIGEKEKSMMKKSMTELIDCNDQCKGYVMPGVGHGVPLHSPTIFHQLVEEWMEEE